MSDQQKQLHASAPKPSHQGLRCLAGGTLGVALFGLSSLTLASTVIFLILATPFLVVSSPVLVPAAIILVLVATGFLFSGGCGVAALASGFWTYRYATENHLLGAVRVDATRMRIAGKAWDMKERAKEYGQNVQNKGQETTTTTQA